MSTPSFWRDDALPFLEARAIADGRGICYAKHAHDTFSIGSITGGASVYLNGRAREHVRAGAVVLMNPGDVHACNPLGDEPWSYRMFHIDAGWLGAIQREGGAFQPYVPVASRDPRLFQGLEALYTTCIDPSAGALEKQGAAVDFLTVMHDALQPAARSAARAGGNGPAHGILRAAEYLRDNLAGTPSLDDVCAAAGLSPSYLIRAFKARYGMTPHAYLVNCRIEYSRALLRRGRPIADAALAAGFADQAHLQRAFKRHVAATPGQYRRTG